MVGILIGMTMVEQGKGVVSMVPITGPYGDVLVFKTKEDAEAAGAVKVYRLVTAKMPRKKVVAKK